MKILTIHADFIEFEAKKKAFAAAEEGIIEGKQRVNDCLVIFTAVEKRDESNTAGIVQRYVQEIKNIAQQVNAKTLVLYPYAHLSSQLSNPKIAEQVMKEAEQQLKEKFSVTRAPFGWYKAFTIACKGHPLSELSREFTADESGSSVAQQASNTAQLKREYKDEPFTLDTRKLTPEEKVNLSGAILVAKSVKDLFPQAKIASSNFYHDQVYVDILNVKLKQDDLSKIEKQVEKVSGQKIQFKPTSAATITEELQKNILADLGKNGMAYTFDSIQIVPLFKDAFVSSSDNIKALKIVNLGSAYWKNNEKNQQLTRVYSVAFDSKEKLDLYQQQREDAENRSHLKIGKEQGLFVVSELVGAGMPLLAPKGTIIRNEILKFLWDLHKDKGYKQVWTPHLAKEQLYKTSGHWDKFGDELFHVLGKEEKFLMKPMNCPHHMQIYNNFSWSYRDLPVRFFEPATIYRDEKSGQLLGLSRVRAITQDDGHLFCRVAQIGAEVRTIVGAIHQFYRTLKMDSDYWVRFSVRGEDRSKFLGSDEVWNQAEAALESAAKELKLPYKRGEGEAAFYGPKLDFMFKDALGREWQLSTIQCDFNLPERFNLSYINEEGKKERPVVIHRAISGSLERFMSVLIEHFAGKFPLWLSPVQVKIVTVTDRNIPFAQEVYAKLMAEEIRVELDDAAETIGRKVRNAQLEKVNFIVTVGDKEVEQGTLAVRSREGNVTFGVAVDTFIAELKEKIKKKVIE